MRLLILNGPNLNLLGTRETDIYGSESLESLERTLRDGFPDVEISFAQSNIEGELVNAIQRAEVDNVDGIVFNPGGYGHTSVAIRDAIAAVRTPVVEVHISNVYAREEFRQTMLLSPVCKGVITGLGMDGYRLAVRAFLETDNA